MAVPAVPGSIGSSPPRLRACDAALLGLAIGLALADSSVVTLALPDILGQFDVDVTTVAWVLTSYNLALALLAIPAAYVARRRPRPAFAVGAVVFAGASLLCGLAPSFEVLVGARCVQAAGGALVVIAALDLSPATTGSDARAAHVWVLAGVLGASLGPAAGGILTEALGWESIFIAQVPLALATLVALRGVSVRPDPGSGRAAALDAERRVAAALGRARRGALPHRPSARGRVGDVAGRGRASS